MVTQFHLIYVHQVEQPGFTPPSLPWSCLWLRCFCCVAKWVHLVYLSPNKHHLFRFLCFRSVYFSVVLLLPIILLLLHSILESTFQLCLTSNFNLWFSNCFLVFTFSSLFHFSPYFPCISSIKLWNINLIWNNSRAIHVLTALTCQRYNQDIQVAINYW